MLVVDQCFYGRYVIYAIVRDPFPVYTYLYPVYYRCKRIAGKCALQLTKVLVDKSYDNNIYLFTLQNNRMIYNK